MKKVGFLNFSNNFVKYVSYIIEKENKIKVENLNYLISTPTFSKNDLDKIVTLNMLFIYIDKQNSNILRFLHSLISLKENIDIPKVSVITFLKGRRFPFVIDFREFCKLLSSIDSYEIQSNNELYASLESFLEENKRYITEATHDEFWKTVKN